MCSARNRSRAAFVKPTMFVPRTETLPSAGLTIPHIRLNKVDFPPPDGPTSKVRDDAGKEKLSMEISNLRPLGQAKRTPDIFTISGVAAFGV